MYIFFTSNLIFRVSAWDVAKIVSKLSKMNDNSRRSFGTSQDLWPRGLILTCFFFRQGELSLSPFSKLAKQLQNSDRKRSCLKKREYPLEPWNSLYILMGDSISDSVVPATLSVISIENPSVLYPKGDRLSTTITEHSWTFRHR